MSLQTSQAWSLNRSYNRLELHTTIVIMQTSMANIWKWSMYNSYVSPTHSKTLHHLSLSQSCSQMVECIEYIHIIMNGTCLSWKRQKTKPLNFNSQGYRHYRRVTIIIIIIIIIICLHSCFSIMPKCDMW